MQKTNIQKSQALFIDGKDRTDEIESYAFEGNKCLVTYKNNGKTYAYHQHRIKIVKSALQSAESKSVFSYLKQIAEAVGLTTEEGTNILADHYDKILLSRNIPFFRTTLTGNNRKKIRTPLLPGFFLSALT